jgi:hypothetical protein
MCLQIAAGVDDDTWLSHLRRGDYSRWFSRRIAARNFRASPSDIIGQNSCTCLTQAARAVAA